MDYFAKKQWIRIAVCVALLAVVTLFMTGVIGGRKEVTYTLPDEKQEAQAGEAAPAAAEASAEKAIPVSGGYQIEKENQFGKVTVFAYVRDGKITFCKIIPEGENNFLKEETAAEWAKAIVESGRADPDAISSASLTFSSGTVMEAVTEIMDRGGVKPAEKTAAEPAAAPAEEPKAEEPAAPEPEQAAEPEAAAEPAPAEAAAPAAAEAPAEKVMPVSGGYRIEKENQFGKVTVLAYVRDGKIASCKIIPEGENNFLKEEIAAEWAKAIVDSGRADPDAISGATLTFSSGTVMEAVTEIMDRGGVKPAEEPKAEEPAAAPAEEPRAEEPAAAQAEEPKAEEPAAAPAEEPAAEEPAAAPAEEPKAEEPAAAPAEEPKAEEPKAEEPAAPEPEQAAEPEAAAEPAPAEAAAPAAAEVPAEKAVPVTGGYRIEKENQFGKVTVIAYIRDGKITSCKIIPEGENNFLKEETAAEWAKAIVESGRADPDAISSASLTFSSGTVMEAVTEIMDRGGVKPAETAAEPAAAPAEEPKAEESEAAPAEEPKAEEPAVPEPEQAAEPEAAAEPAPAEAAAPAAAEVPAEKAAPVTGGYRVEKENQFGKVTVIAYIRDGKIASCKIIPEGENNFLKEETAAEWAKAIVESGSAKPDVISGATLTFSAGSVTEAMTEIMDTAAGK